MGAKEWQNSIYISYGPGHSQLVHVTIYEDTLQESGNALKSNSTSYCAEEIRAQSCGDPLSKCIQSTS